jgi:hypothetical protein
LAEVSKEVMSVIEDNVKWLNDAARHFETLAHKLGEEEKSKWSLLTTVYRERAKLHEELAMRLRGDAQVSSDEGLALQ